MYFCLCCQQLHQTGYSSAEIIYSSGFRYTEEILYKAGMCFPLAELSPAEGRNGQELAAS
ncbi:DUF3973 domain-containing protein [Paenibacillus filicis]|uniref:DUF3973 domain-containing protein n=1 Tax=Paenibacillus filicis TaxID=669464 RepID=A0ABU9DER8_9BACL